jgi:hypothetical protein
MLIAQLCLPAEYAAVTDRRGVYAPRSAKPSRRARETAGVELETFEWDNFNAAPESAYSRHCEDVACVFYLKHCDPRPLACEYVYAVYGVLVETE